MMQFLKELIISSAPDDILIFIVNLNNKLKNRPVLLSKFDDDIYALHEGKSVIYTGRRNRAWRYFLGIQKQCDSLARDYMLHNVSFKEGDIVIDCGANNGEIGVWAQQKNLSYYAFEPESIEARCCDLNNYQGETKTIRKGLWHEETTLHWYSKPDSADSSLIEMEDTDHVVSIETTTLNHFVNNNELKHVRLLKLEAEGAEPEVLQGALDVLDRIDYVAVDCGYERGIDKNHTFMEVYRVLKDHGFDIVSAEFKRVVFLFKRDEASL